MRVQDRAEIHQGKGHDQEQQPAAGRHELDDYRNEQYDAHPRSHHGARAGSNTSPNLLRARFERSARWVARVYFLAFSLSGPEPPLTARLTGPPGLNHRNGREAVVPLCMGWGDFEIAPVFAHCGCGRKGGTGSEPCAGRRRRLAAPRPTRLLYRSERNRVSFDAP